MAGDSLGTNAPVEAAIPDLAAAGSSAILEPAIPPPFELCDDFDGLACSEALMTIAGFGSLLSETSARSTFPDLQNFRLGRLQGWRRVFAHQCDIFFARGIARPETREVSSLSVEEHPDSEIIVTLFEVEATPASISAFIEREHEFRFIDDVLPCRVYMRHCVLASQKLGAEAYSSFLDGTYLGDRTTTLRQHLDANPDILEELPPPSLMGRYSG